MLIVALPMSLLFALGLGIWLNLWNALTLPFVVLAAWALLRFVVPRDGVLEPTVTSTRHGMAHVWLFSGMLGGQALMIFLRLLGFNRNIACGAYLA
jgi:hypothetical protein